jgi:hypothetical protein
MKTSLFRGKNIGVFTGPNGYYLGAMTADGSHYQPANGGNGWSEKLRERLNEEASRIEEGRESEDES